MELIRWTLVEKFHWPLREVDSLSLGDLAQYMDIEDGREKAGGDG